MTGVRVVSLVLRFIALWCVLLAVQSTGVVLAVQHQHQEYPGPSLWYAVIPAVIFVAVAITIWRGPQRPPFYRTAIKSGIPLIFREVFAHADQTEHLASWSLEVQMRVRYVEHLDAEV